jgi:DNA-binding LacI/PurR family transcriptional regulator
MTAAARDVKGAAVPQTTGANVPTAGTSRGGGGAARSRRPRLDDVAARVGLSPASVSLVLRNAPGPSEATRQRVFQAAAELGYRADMTASLLARRRTNLLGAMLDVRNTFHAEVVEHLHEAADVVGYELVLSTVTRTRSEERAVETLLDFRCEALILLGPEVPTARLRSLDRLQPVVVVGRRIAGSVLDVVRSADHAGVGLAVDHLAELGHRDIAYVDGGTGTIAADRRRGYKTAMRRHGLLDRVTLVPGDHTEGSGAQAAQTFLNTKSPTAVITFNDRCALGLLDALSRGGVEIPGTMSVVGYDDSPSAQLAYINLTSVGQDAPHQAQQAVAAAVERLDYGRRVPREVVLTPRLVVRGTTAPPPKGHNRSSQIE